MLKTILTMLFAVLLSAACGPIYDTQYSYVPPNSAEGRRCVEQCRRGAASCEQSCRAQESMCLRRADTDAMMDYQSYRMRYGWRGRRARNVDLDDFEARYRAACYRGNGCERSCESGFQACFEGCGGRVVANRVCTAFCD